MVDVRITQDGVEVAGSNTIEVRQTQEGVEVIGHTPVEVRESQEIIEVLGHTTIEVRKSQDIIELMYIPTDAPPRGLSGLYFINPANTYDIYYNDTKKIPNPTIRTALFGE